MFLYTLIVVLIVFTILYYRHNTNNNNGIHIYSIIFYNGQLYIEGHIKNYKERVGIIINIYDLMKKGLLLQHEIQVDTFKNPIPLTNVQVMSPNMNYGIDIINKDTGSLVYTNTIRYTNQVYSFEPLLCLTDCVLLRAQLFPPSYLQIPDTLFLEGNYYSNFPNIMPMSDQPLKLITKGAILKRVSFNTETNIYTYDKSDVISGEIQILRNFANPSEIYALIRSATVIDHNIEDMGWVISYDEPSMSIVYDQVFSLKTFLEWYNHTTVLNISLAEYLGEKRSERVYVLLTNTAIGVGDTPTPITEPSLGPLEWFLEKPYIGLSLVHGLSVIGYRIDPPHTCSKSLFSGVFPDDIDDTNFCMVKWNGDQNLLSYNVTRVNDESVLVQGATVSLNNKHIIYRFPGNNITQEELGGQTIPHFSSDNTLLYDYTLTKRYTQLPTETTTTTNVVIYMASDRQAFTPSQSQDDLVSNDFMLQGSNGGTILLAWFDRDLDNSWFPHFVNSMTVLQYPMGGRYRLKTHQVCMGRRWIAFVADVFIDMTSQYFIELTSGPLENQILKTHPTRSLISREKNAERVYYDSLQTSLNNPNTELGHYYLVGVERSTGLQKYVDIVQFNTQSDDRITIPKLNELHFIQPNLLSRDTVKIKYILMGFLEYVHYFSPNPTTTRDELIEVYRDTNKFPNNSVSILQSISDKFEDLLS